MQNQSIQALLTRHFAAAVSQVAGTRPEATDPQIRPAGDPKFGDYQCNIAMSLAKPLGAKPRDVAARIKAAVEPFLADIAEPLEIAGPGFLNIRLKAEFLARQLGDIPASAAAAEDRVGLTPVERPLRVVVEYSQPNVAKQMHVGHLRTTIIGDVFARVLAFLGHDVVRQNHIGDWGTQFGMLIRWYREHPLPTPATHPDVLAAMEADYRAAHECFQTDAQFANEARLAVGQLQSGDATARHLWARICEASLRAIHDTYARLGVLLEPADVCGESFYNDRLQPLVEDLLRRGAEGPRDPGAQGPSLVVRRDAGAVVVYLYDEAGAPLFKNADGQPLGMIIQKSDGAFLYATTDLAAIRYRLQDLKFPTGIGAQRVIYVTDDRQRLHFQQFFACARAAGWVTPEHEIDHVTYGAVLGEDRKPLKTRTGGTIRLSELLDEAENRAYELLKTRDQANEGSRDQAEETTAAFTEDEMRDVARRVGIASVKYADLRNDRNTPYVFSWDKMVSFQGNTAPYMLYAYARIRSIYRKAAERSGAPDVYAPGVRVPLDHPLERALALRLARLRETIDIVAADLTPHVLCTYLYDLAADFMRFYESCSVLSAADEASRLGRLRLCDLTARTLRLALGLLGIGVVERM